MPRARVRALALALVAAVLIAATTCLLAPAPAGAANYSVGQNADMLLGGSSYSDRSWSPASNVVANWRFDADTGQVADATGHGHTLSTFNAPGSPGGPSAAFREALGVDGTSQYASAPTSAAFDLTSNFTIEAWFRTIDISGNPWPTIVARQKSSGNFDTNYELFFDRSSNQLGFAFTKSGGTVWSWVTTSSVPYTNGIWHHAVGTYDGADARLYVDGVQRASAPFTGAIDTPGIDLTIGQTYVGSTDFFKGDIDEVRLSSVARSAAEILADYTAQLPHFQHVAEYGMVAPRAIDVDGSGSVYVADTRMNRVTRWASPIADGQAFDTVLAKPPATATPNIRWSWATTGLTTSTSNPVGVAVAGDGATLKTAVADAFDRRVVLMTKSEGTLVDGDTGTIALGQPDMVSNANGTGASNMDGPGGVWTDGTRVAVADSAHNRVLLWDSWPTSSGQAADHVIGQPGYGASNVCPNRAWSGASCYAAGSAQSDAGRADNTLLNPTDVHFDGTYFYVVDNGNDRVLVWSGWPATDGSSASWVIGQANFTVKNSSTGIKGLYGPASIATTGAGASHHIAISSQLGNRVTVYDAWPTLAAGAKTYPDASAVLGQSGHGLGSRNRGPGGTGRAAANSLSSPQGVAFDPSGNLWIVDEGNHRVVCYLAGSLTTGSSATRVLGHRGATAMSASVPADSINLTTPTVYTLSSYNIWGSRLAITPGGQLLESSYDESAVRIWNNPTTTDAPYDRRWGQPSRADAGPNGPDGQPGAARTSRPGQAWSDGTKLLLADIGNHRVLVWTSMPATDTTPADYVIGQSNFTSVGSGSGLAQLNQPSGVTSDGTDVYVADRLNHRVLIYRNFWGTLADGKSANVVIGTGAAGTSSTQLSSPHNVALFQDQLLVSDRGNHRILVYNDEKALVTGSPADAVIGQASFAANATNTQTSYLVDVAAAGGAVIWAQQAGTRVLDPIPRSGFVTAGMATLGTDGVGYQPAPTQSIQAYPSGVAARAGSVWVASAQFGRITRYTDATAPTISTQPTATARCDGTVTISWGTSESTTMEVRYDTVSRAGWGAGYVSSTTDLYAGVARYAGLTHTTDLSIPLPGTYYARVQGQDWAGMATPTSNEISFVVPATCAAPTAMFGDDSNAQAGTGRANPSSGNTPIKSTSFHTSWQNVAGVTMDRYQGQTWTTPPEQAGGVWHLDSALAGDANGIYAGSFVWTGAPNWVAGRFGTAAATAPGVLLRVPSNAALTKANDFTVDLWFKTGTLATQSTYPVLLSKTDFGCGGTERCNYSIEFDQAANTFCGVVVTTLGVEKQACRTATGITDNQWHHVAMSVTSGNLLTQYVDGQLTTSTALGAAARTGAGDPLTVGATADNANAFTGVVDEVRFTPTALSAAEILGYYRTQRPHLQLLADTGVGGGSGQAIGADCATATRCADLTYGTPGSFTSDILRAGARYYSRLRMHTRTNNYWTTWANDWFETDSATSISISVGATLNLGTPPAGSDAFGSSTILVDSNDAGGYQLTGRDASNTVGMTGTPSGSLPDMQSYLSAPVTWAANNPLGIGYTVRSATGNRLAKWGAAGPFPENDVTNNLYTGLGAVDLLLHQRTTYSAATDTIVLTTRLDAPLNQAPAAYTTTVQLTAVANP